ncbi:hypothetical protein C922_05127 [Plasmodium inui San Antonio 1]|uniref:Uncharacterized protein n=1 Tax=Plasmodium inui San Antonio 1 TaxID=1237626 RepID=W6ZU83_9APIC|nr:hypothetical protein C922_05127 [Plasmodium inui San Antonio 1]EUD64487.1 hypothetical protein C922_05127 [Plasmodium inui San Antonio 1]
MKELQEGRRLISKPKRSFYNYVQLEVSHNVTTKTQRNGERVEQKLVRENIRATRNNHNIMKEKGEEKSGTRICHPIGKDHQDNRGPNKQIPSNHIPPKDS